jgi:hypothetical protein
MKVKYFVTVNFYVNLYYLARFQHCTIYSLNAALRIRAYYEHACSQNKFNITHINMLVKLYVLHKKTLIKYELFH